MENPDGPEGRDQRTTVQALTDPETALGFRLAGVAVEVAQTAEEGRSRLIGLLNGGQEGVVLYNEDFISGLSDRLRKRVEESVRPVLFPIPVIRSWREGEGKEAYLGRLLKRLIGYQIKMNQ